MKTHWTKKSELNFDHETLAGWGMGISLCFSFFFLNMVKCLEEIPRAYEQKTLY